MSHTLATIYFDLVLSAASEFEARIHGPCKDLHKTHHSEA